MSWKVRMVDLLADQIVHYKDEYYKNIQEFEATMKRKFPNTELVGFEKTNLKLTTDMKIEQNMEVDIDA